MEKIKKCNNEFYIFHLIRIIYHLTISSLFLRQATPLPDRLDRAALQVGWSDLGGMVRGEAGGPVPQGSTDYPAGGSESQAWGGGCIPGGPHAAGPLLILPNLYIV